MERTPRNTQANDSTCLATKCLSLYDWFNDHIAKLEEVMSDMKKERDGLKQLSESVCLHGVATEAEENHLDRQPQENATQMQASGSHIGDTQTVALAPGTLHSSTPPSPSSTESSMTVRNQSPPSAMELGGSPPGSRVHDGMVEPPPPTLYGLLSDEEAIPKAPKSVFSPYASVETDEKINAPLSAQVMEAEIEAKIVNNHIQQVGQETDAIELNAFARRIRQHRLSREKEAHANTLIWMTDLDHVSEDTERKKI